MDNFQSLSGEELFDRYREGDHIAFESIVELYGHDFMLFINGMVRDQHEATHLMIESFAQLALRGKAFNGSSSLKTYLYTIGRNHAIRYIKARRKEKTVSIEELVGELHDARDLPETNLEREENRRMLHKAMMELKPEHKNVLILLYFENMSYIEAGLVMKKSQIQVRGLAYRAKHALKKILLESNRIEL